jgi:hypothetical protein
MGDVKSHPPPVPIVSVFVTTDEIFPVVTFSVVTKVVSAHKVFVLSAAVCMGDVNIHPLPAPI